MAIDNLDEDKLDRLKSQLLTSGVAKDNQALFQVINQLIGAVKDINNEVIGIINGVVVDLDIKDLTFLTADDETPILPNSRELTAGFHITFDDTNPGQRIVNWTTILPINLATDVTGRLALANLVQGSALSVLGVSGNATADHADIVAASDGNVLRRSGTVVGFGAIDLASSNAVTGRLLAANLFQGSALSVLGVTGNSPADQASIAAASDNQVLRRSGTTLAFGAIDLSSASAVSNRLALANLVQGVALSILGVAGNATADYAGIVAGTDGQVLRRSGTTVGFGALNLAAAAAITGLLPDANLSSNVPLKNGTNAFTGANSFATNPLDLLVGQLLFPGTQNPSSNVNTLDDYDEGTFTPVLTINSLTTGITYTTQAAAYTKIGDFVFVEGSIVLTSKGVQVGVLLISGFPFIMLNTAATGPLGYCFYNNFNAAVNPVGIAGVANTTSAVLFGVAAGNATPLNNVAINNNSSFNFGFCYKTNT